MSTEFKKLAVFGVIIAFLTSSYVTFLATGLKQGFFTDGFFTNWMMFIPKAYIAVLPFVMVMGPLVRRLVDKMFQHNEVRLTAFNDAALRR